MITYLTHLTLCWTILFLAYYFFLKRETFFMYNRWYLLTGLVLGMIIPLIDWTILFTHQPESLGQIYVAPIQSQIHQIDVYVSSSDQTPLWHTLLTWIYIAGIFIASVKLIKGLNEIRSLRQDAKIIRENGYNLVLTNQIHVPFSFMNSVYWSRELYADSDEKDRILAHEAKHVSALHSLDILFIEILCIAFWFHPLAYLYRKEIKEVHEYEADAAACVLGNKKAYGQLLLNQAQSGLQLALANHFFYSQLKNRFKMMTRNPSTKKAKLKYLIAIPIIGFAALLFSFAQKEDIQQNDKFTATDTIPPPPPPPMPYIGMEIIVDQAKHIVKPQDLVFVNGEELGPFSDNPTLENVPNGSYTFEVFTTQQAKEKWGQNINSYVFNYRLKEPEEQLSTQKMLSNANTSDEIFRVVERMPRFPGCEELEGTNQEIKACADKKMLEFLYDNIQYPTAAKKDKIEGNVVISFIVEKDGSITDPKVIRDPGAGLGEESVRVVNMMGDLPQKWSPGLQRGQPVRVQFILPVKFQLNKKENVTKSEDLAENIEAIDVMPRYPGCEDLKGSDVEKAECANKAMLEYIYSNIRYPAEARKKGVQGAVTATIAVMKDGSIDHVQILEEPGGGLGNEVTRLLTEMKRQGKWTPAYKEGEPVNFVLTLPVQFRLKGDEVRPFQESTVQPEKRVNPLSEVVVVSYTKSNPKVKLRTEKDVDALVVLDGTILGRTDGQKTLDQIDPSSIESFNVLKGNTAMEKYGDQGKDGVIEITSKAPELMQNKVSPDTDQREDRLSEVVVMGHSNKKSIKQDEYKALIVLDGTILGHANGQNTLDQIDPSSIESINVLKGNTALEKYGDQAKDGVIEITSKVPKLMQNSAELVLSDFTLYPNPASSELKVEFEGPAGEYRLEVVDIKGATQMSKDLFNDSRSQTIMDIGRLHAGMYYLIIRSGSKVTAKMFVKE